MDLKYEIPTANLSSKRPCQVIDLAVKSRAIKDGEGGKSVWEVSPKSGKFHPTTAVALKYENG